MTGGDRAGYKQISGLVDTLFIGPSTGSTDVIQSTDYTNFADNGWHKLVVISSGAVFASITAPGMAGSSNIDSATTWEKGAEIACNQITAFKLSSKTTNHAVMAYGKVLL